MTQGMQRAIVRWVHIILSIPIIGYVYSPFEDIPEYAPLVRFVAAPVIVLTGLWMWKGHVVLRLVSRKSASESSGKSRAADAEPDPAPGRAGK